MPKKKLRNWRGKKILCYLTQLPSKIFCVTHDFLEDFIAACKKEGVIYFVSISKDQGNSQAFWHNYDTLPKFRDYPDGARRTQKEDFQQFVDTIDFTTEAT